MWLKYMKEQLFIPNLNNMKKKKTPWMDFYKKYMKIGNFSGTGICDKLSSEMDKSKEWNMVSPNIEELKKLWCDGQPFVWWGRESRCNSIDKMTPLRETVILLCSAINDEL